jgi:hypothetical protein
MFKLEHEKVMWINILFTIKMELKDRIRVHLFDVFVN